MAAVLKCVSCHLPLVCGREKVEGVTVHFPYCPNPGCRANAMAAPVFNPAEFYSRKLEMNYRKFLQAP